MFLAAWKQVFEKVQEARIDRRMKLVPFAGSVNCPFHIHYHLCCLIFVILFAILRFYAINEATDVFDFGSSGVNGKAMFGVRQVSW